MILSKQLGFFVLAFLLFFSFCHVSFAQTPCGHIISAGDVRDLNLGIENDVIGDCDNPFGVTIDPPNPYTVQIEGKDIAPGETASLPNGRTNNISFSGRSNNASVNTGIFKHVENNYEYVSRERPEPTEEDYRTFAGNYFDTQAERDLYLEIVVYSFEHTDLDTYFFDSETGDDIIDGVTGETVQDRYFNFVDALYVDFDDSLPYLDEGTYTMLFYEQHLGFSQRTILDTVKDFFISTAYAQCVQCFPDHFYTVTFTIAKEKLGASSVLFLPGIQASRLYKSSLFGLGEDQIWPPNALFDNDVNNLAMDEVGVSEEDIYTRDIIDTTAGAGNVYGGFTTFMDDLDSDGVIDDWASYAYDWRYSVTDIAQNGTQYENEMKDAVAEVQRLAASSFSGKVTIVGHSNGGLLAKAIMLRLEAEGKTNLIDKIILIATPQLGTPKAIGTILHGYDQGDQLGGLVISAAAARKIINNLPGAYGLLPSQKYFEGLDVPLVTFSNSDATAAYRAIYSTAITSYADIVKFLRGNDSLERGLGLPVSTPATANSVMLNDALLMHNSQLDDWVAPEGIEVTEIAGTGLPTMKAIEYRGVVEDKCLSAGPAGIICTPETELKPYANLTHYGDGTVVQRSAEAYGGEKQKYFVNLKEFNIDTEDHGGSSIFHYNITEAAPVQDLLSDLLVGSSTQENQFVSTSHTEFDDEYEIEIIDSPVRLLATDTQGNQTGVVLVNGEQLIKQDIPGSQYFEFGGTKYFIVPKGTDRTTRLYGEDYGGYTLTVATLEENDEQTIQSVLENASTTPELVAEYSNVSGVFSTVITDVDGDGVTDYETSVDGEIIEEDVPVTYGLLIDTIEELGLPRFHERILLSLVERAKFYGNKTSARFFYRKFEDRLLESAQSIIKYYAKRRYISAAEAIELKEMIEILKDKQ